MVLSYEPLSFYILGERFSLPRGGGGGWCRMSVA